MNQTLGQILSGVNAASFWTVLSWVAALVLHFTGQNAQTQQVVDAAAGIITALHVGGTHVKSAVQGKAQGGTQA